MMPCSGLAADTYDLYVLGLLEGKERAELERQLAEGCPICVQGVRRSIDLWIVFASTLENAEPSKEFRSGLIRAAELSKKAIVLPKKDWVERSNGSSRLAVLLGASAVVSVLILGAWYAGRQAGNIQAEQLSAKLNQLAREVSFTQSLLTQESIKKRQAEQTLQSAGKGTTAADLERTRLKLQQIEAEANQYKTAIVRQQESAGDNVRVINLLSTPGIRLIPFKGAETAVASTAYALLAESKRLIVIAANLPRLAGGKEFQLWVSRATDPKILSAAVFSPDEENRAIITFEDEDLSQITAMAITDEPSGGSASPTGTKLLAATLSAE